MTALRRGRLAKRAGRVGGAILALVVLATTASAQQAVRVASKIDTEGALLGNMIVAMLEGDGIKTIDALQLGPTNILRSAIIAGQIDIYPEYTGNGALFYAMESDPVWRDAVRGYERVRALDLARHDLVWLQPAPADNRWAIAVRGDVARAHELATMADFAAWVRRGGRIKLAASAEFVESPAALPAFEKVYHFTLAPSQLVVLAGGDTAVTLRAAAQDISGIDAAMAYATDGALSILDLAVMSDPEAAQIVYAPAPVVRKPVLDQHPQIKDALAPVFASLDAPTLRRLNARIVAAGEDARQVASDYLRRRGFLH